MRLKELSEILNLSPTTVSRALGGYPEVSEKTRTRVVLAAAQHGYVPNVHARSLATGVSRAIGIVVPVSARNIIHNPIFADFLAGVGESCASLDFEIVLRVVEERDVTCAYSAMKSSSSIGGVIVQNPLVDDERMRLLTDLGLPFVVHGRSSGYEGEYSWLDVNSFRAIKRATGFLINLGHRDFALINGPSQLDFSIRRKNGFLAALSELGLEHGNDSVFESDMTVLHGYQTIRELMDRDRPPSAIVTSSIIVAWGAKQALDELGLQSGTDISIVSFDDALSYIGNDASMPVFTTVRSSVREAGFRIARILISQIRSGNFAPVHELMEADLVVGQSTGTRSQNA